MNEYINTVRGGLTRAASGLQRTFEDETTRKLALGLGGTLAMGVTRQFVPIQYKDILTEMSCSVTPLMISITLGLALEKTAREIVTGLGGNLLQPIALKDIDKEDRKKLKNKEPIMSADTQTTWDGITNWIKLPTKLKFAERESNYDCVYMYGPPGTGKTQFANALFSAVDDSYHLKLANITAGDLKERGAEKLKRLKEDILKIIDKNKDGNNKVCLGFFLDEVEGSLNKDRNMNPGVVNEYLTFIDDIQKAAAGNKNVYILGALATNYDNQVDDAANRDKRVTYSLHLDYPDNKVKLKILEDVIQQTGYEKVNKDALWSKLEGKLKDNTDNPIKTALEEKNLVGASIVNAVELTQRDMQIADDVNDVNFYDTFIEKLAQNITASAKKAQEKREKYEKDIQAREAIGTHLSRMASALEKYSQFE